MKLFILKEKHFPELPKSITLIDDYETESIVDEKSGKLRATGEVLLIDGEIDEIKKWLNGIDEFWITTNPMLGKWDHIIVEKDH